MDDVADWSAGDNSLQQSLSPGTVNQFGGNINLNHTHSENGNPIHVQSPWSLNDGFSHNPHYLASQDELRGIIFSIAQSGAPTRAGSPATDAATEPYLVQNHITTSQNTGLVTTQQRREITTKQIIYLKNYVKEVAPWLDMFDSQNTFGIQLPILAHDFPALHYAILAISARQMERKNGTRDSFDSLELYQESIRLLSPLLQVRDAKVIATCVLLCCLEMMSARGQDWQRHLEGCAALFNAFDIHGFSSGLLQAVFWCYARMDVCGALISDGTQGTLLKTSKWLVPGYTQENAHQLFLETQSPDMYANYAVYLCAKTCELLADHTQYTELGQDNGCTGREFENRWSRLWEDLQRWFAERPAELLPVQTTKTGPFVHVFFSFWAAISSNQLYHTASILLLGIKPRAVKLQKSSITSSVWHARRVCGISLANAHHGCLNNAVQPLWVAGRLFSHTAEHEIIIKLIRDIEAASGWAACWRIHDLKVAWGYAVP